VDTTTIYISISFQNMIRLFEGFSVSKSTQTV